MVLTRPLTAWGDISNFIVNIAVNANETNAIVTFAVYSTDIRHQVQTS